MSDYKINAVVTEIEYGNIRVKLDEIMKARDISTYQLNVKTNIKFQTIQNLRENTSSRIDFEVLAKICYALDVKVEDVLEYEPVKKSKEK